MKKNNPSFIINQNIGLFLLSVLFWGSLCFLFFGLQPEAVHRDTVARWSFILTYGVYGIFIGISAILFFAKKIALATWKKIVSMGCGFFLYNVIFSSLFVDLFGKIDVFLGIINCVFLISIITISFYNPKYVRLVAIGFATELMFTVSYTACYIYSMGSNDLLYEPLGIIASVIYFTFRVSSLTYAFFRLYHLVTFKNRWHLGVFLPTLLMNYLFFYQILAQGVRYLMG